MTTRDGDVLLDSREYDKAKAAYESALNDDPQDAEAHNGLGRVALIQQRNQDAERHFKAARDLLPDEPAYHHNIGLVLERMDDAAGAEAAYRKAIHLKPEFAAAYLTLGRLLHKQRRYAEARDQFVAAVKLDASSAEANNDLGRAYFANGETEAAETAFSTASQLNPSEPSYHYNRGLALRDLARTGEAEAAFRMTLSLREDDSAARFELGKLLYNQERYEDAVRELDLVVRREADNADAWNEFGRAHLKLDRCEAAIEAFRKAATLAPNEPVYFRNCGLALKQAKRFDEAIQYFAQTIAIDAHHAAAYHDWGNLLYEQKRYAEAEEKLALAVAQEPDNDTFQYSLGSVLASQERYAEACRHYEASLKIKPSYDAHDWFGIALVALGKYPEGIQQYQKAIALNDRLPYAYYDWGNAVLDQKRYNEALQFFEKAVAADESYPYSYHNIAYILERQGRYRAAREVWSKARDVYERGRAQKKYFLGADDFQYYGTLVQDVFGDLSLAEDSYQEGLKLQPGHNGILTNLTSLYLELKEKSADESKGEWHWKAREAYRAGLESLAAGSEARVGKKMIDPVADTAAGPGAVAATTVLGGDAERTLNQMGQLHIKLGEYSKAEECFLAALKGKRADRAHHPKVEENFGEIHAGLGVVYSRKEDYKKAAEQFQLALAIDIDNLTLRSNLAEMYLKLKLIDKAESEYKQILDITPDHVEALIGLGEVYTALGEDGDPEMYELAISHFTQGIDKANGEYCSKRLKAKELAAVLYSRAYARVKSFETSTLKSNDDALREAAKDFRHCYARDHTYVKAKRAAEKIEKRLSRFSPETLSERVGPIVISILSLWIFVFTQVGFFMKVISQGYYLSFSFGALIFMVAGFYLPQILKLKVAGIELEKSSVNQIATTAAFGLKR